ncbi:MAG: hypothetical protein KGL39_25795 [Patescibacteria group bacterium]|nr:hypothetical protein [Patescibacteria group bacterium]
MFVPRFFFEKFMTLLEAQYASAQRQTEDGLQRVLSAKDSEVRAVIAAKDRQISFLTAALEEQRGLVAHERHRAEAAVDILLTKNAEAGPIRNADLIRQTAEREAQSAINGIPRPPKRDDELKRVFAQVNDVLGEDDEPAIGRDEVVMVAGQAMPS